MSNLSSTIKRFLILLVIVVMNLPAIVMAAPIPAVDKDAIDGDYVHFDNGEVSTSSCSATGQPVGQVTGSVYILGDSITNAARNDIQTKLAAGGFTVAGINADPGRAISADTAGGNPSGLEAAAADAAIIGGAEIVVIALGTNSGIEDLDVQIPAMINAVRAASSTAQIYWVNLFYTAATTVTRDERNAIIAAHSTTSNYAIIDTVAAGIQLGPDGTHPTVAGQVTFANTIVAGINGQTPTNTAPGGDTVGNVSLDGNPLHILTYPNIINEAAAAAAINNYISGSWPSSPFVGLGSSFIAGAKRSNVNPFLAVGHLQHENGFATAGGGTSGWHGNTYSTLAGALSQNQATRAPSYNAFGTTTSAASQHVYYRRSVVTGSDLDAQTPPSNDGYKVYTVKQWDSWQDSLDGPRDWFSGIRASYLNIGSTYESPDFATYVSHYAPNSDGNSEAAYIAGLLATIDAVAGSLAIGPGGASACIDSGVPGGSGNIGIDGYTFPLAPQTKAVGGIKVGQTVTTHHDGTPAFDLFSTIAGADVYAIYGGTPIRVNTSFGGIPGCSSIQFKADDGFYYWYGHLKNTVVTPGVHVASGTKIAQIADKVNFTSACWGGAPHLHIDRGCSIGGVPQPGGGDACRDPTFIPFLSKIYEFLPPG